MCIPKSNHKKLVDDCYPAPKALATSGPEYRPNSNELGRLTYYCENKPAKLTKVGRVLETRAQTDARSAQGSGPAADKGKAGLMITLGVTKNLLTECKSHYNYFIKPAQAIIASALEAALPTPARPRDLELSARAASCFYALASFIDPATTAVDADFSKLLKSFAAMSVERPAGADATLGEDTEQRNRTRLIGLGALAGAVGSDAIYAASSTTLIPTIVPGLAENIKDNRVTLDWLQSEARKASEGEPSYAEFNIAKKPLAIRRTRSITAHVAGEKGPSAEDVVSAAIGTLRGLLRHGDAIQVQAVVQNVIAWLDGKAAIAIPAPSDGRQLRSQWENTDWCCWLAQALCSWTALQYRFVVLNTLVEHLVENCEGQATTKHLSLIEMSRSILTGQLSLIGLSTSDTLSNLAALAVRRVYKDTRDSLLPPLVDCISGLGTHVYYADQINDIAEEIAGRIAALQMPDAAANADSASINAGRVGSTTRGTGQGQAQALNVHIHRQRMANAGPEQRDEAIRVLLFCLMGVLHATHKSSGEIHKAVDVNGSGAGASGATSDEEKKGKAAAGSEGKLGLARAGTRNRVSLSSLLSTANLIASSNHAVRLAYAQTLITLFRDELDREQLAQDTAVFGAATVEDKVNDAISFVHALAAAVHVMCLSKNLTVPAAMLSNLRDSPLETLPQLERINADPGRPGSLNSDGVAAGSGASAESMAALPVDYVAVSQALEQLIGALPCTSALALTPMLAALDKDAGSRLVVDGAASASGGLENQRRIGSRMVVARVLERLGGVFDVPTITKSAQGIIGQIPPFGVEPGPSPVQGLTLPPEIVPFSAVDGINSAGQSSNSSSPMLNASSIVDGLASSKKLQTATKLDANTLKRFLERDWNVNIAVDEAFAGSSPFSNASLPTSSHPSRRPSYVPVNGGGGNSMINGMPNASVEAVSVAGRKSMQVHTTGVNDLREALAASSPTSASGGGGAGSRYLNGLSQDAGSARSPTSAGGLSSADVAERRASRRESRRAGGPGGLSTLGINGSGNTSAVAILDTLKVGVAEDAPQLGPDSTLKLLQGQQAAPAVQPPYAS
ncbi:hypothetical protein BCV70DRAFT_198197 [Testicularia cyperi]|uniref:Protein EFR3 n=1 Tax=Testicularia cyperi TaxID=1882483 RepID=A0A317XV19_9BASI|nr:hypothetical protein BCV70DRAFT_198197 [Testicularia cyperi]